ncbi:hypothetical protein BLA29_010782 [Euroglyphus maynei]|uniref:Uncharacterized protein n=1 Tax=Euroglyphus maynei TaxID=6958 RepID=A0A1Y3AZZ8_EURMA|nr:hypothetical protein BLA29_010782 [Euroglyphus maynei]
MLGNNGYSCVDGKTILTFFGSRRCLSIVQNFNCHLPNKIYNVVATDFTGRMHQDLLITVKSILSSSSELRFNIILVYGNTTATEFNCDHHQRTLITNAISEPFILGTFYPIL